MAKIALGSYSSRDFGILKNWEWDGLLGMRTIGLGWNDSVIAN